MQQSPYPFAHVFQHGTLEIEVYKPVGIDKQQPHEKDELCIIISGCAMFFHKGNTFEVKPGDSLFVPAYDEHRFFSFTEDLVTWVFFFSDKGGEQTR